MKKSRIHSYLKKGKTKKNESQPLEQSARDMELKQKLDKVVNDYEELRLTMVSRFLWILST